MKTVSMKEGVAHIPDSWVVLNEDEAGQYKNACVIQCRNSKKYDVPTFVRFTDLGVDDYNDDFNASTNSMIESKYPKWQDILRQQVKPHYDSNFMPTNIDAVLNAPTIGLFELYSEAEARNFGTYDFKTGEKRIDSDVGYISDF